MGVRRWFGGVAGLLGGSLYSAESFLKGRRRKKDLARANRFKRQLLVEPLESRVLLTVTYAYWVPSGLSTGAVGGGGTLNPSATQWSLNASGGGTMYSWSQIVSDPSPVAVFSGSAGTVNLTAGTTFNPPTIQFSTTGYSISSNTLTIPTGGTTVYVPSGYSATISSALSGGGGLSLGGSGGSGGGILNIGGDNSANTYLGGTAINYGTLKAAYANALPNGSVVTLGASGGGQLALNASQTIGGLSGGGASGGVALGSYSLTLITSSGGSNTFSGVISGGGSLNISGGGRQIFTAINTYTGGTTIGSNATLQLGGGSSGGSGGVAGAIVDNGTLALWPASGNNLSCGNSISGSGGLSIGASGTSGGTVTLSGSNSFVGQTLVNYGTLVASGGGSLSSASLINMSAGTHLTLNSSQTIGGLSGGSSGGVALGAYGLIVNTGAGSTNTFSGVISGSGGSLTVSGGGTEILTATNTYTGSTTIGSSATLQLGNGSGPSGGWLASPITDNGMLTLSAGSSTVNFNNRIGGSGGLTVNDSGGTVTLSGGNSYGGGTWINGGELSIPYKWGAAQRDRRHNGHERVSATGAQRLPDDRRTFRRRFGGAGVPRHFGATNHQYQQRSHPLFRRQYQRWPDLHAPVAPRAQPCLQQPGRARGVRQRHTNPDRSEHLHRRHHDRQRRHASAG